MIPFTDMLDLAGERAGGGVLAASDDFFAEKENLIKTADPVFVAGKYTDRGKWMDGWESRRKRTPGHDWAVIRLGIPGVIHGVVLDTRYFTGNYPEQASLEACTASAGARLEDLTDWIELVPKSPLRGDTQNHVQVAHSQRFTHVRLNIFPDGGVARLRMHGEPGPDWRSLGAEVDLAAAACGASIVDSSDRHYGHPRNMLMPGPGRDMGDGWETRRRRGPGHDWVILRLAAEGTLARVEVDTSHFKGNFPDQCSLDISATGQLDSWSEVLGKSKLQAHTRHVFERELASVAAARFARFHIYPDGGVSRLRLIGRMSEQGRIEANLAALNSAPLKQAVAEFLRCCGSTAWANTMVAGRPYADWNTLETLARSNWKRSKREDWLEAFAAHPRIGQESRSKWTREEQSGVVGGKAETLSELEKLNFQYLGKFGYIFIVCAAGKGPEEVLDNLRRRFKNHPEEEVLNAAEEQRQITRLRLKKLLSE
jgi:allantoicase